MSGGKGLTYQLFDTPGSSGSWTCPAGVTQVIVMGCGGGAGGNGGAKAVQYAYAIGGAGAVMDTAILDVIPGTAYTVTVGAGGAGGAGRTTSGGCNPGSAGTNSSFAGRTFLGAAGQGDSAASNYLESAFLALPMSYRFDGFTDSIFGAPLALPHSAGPHGLTGAQGTASGNYQGGTGGGSGYGSLTDSTISTGGAGGNASTSGNGSAGSAGTSYGAGGGGGGATSTGTTSGAGGAGYQGAIVVCWVEA